MMHDKYNSHRYFLELLLIPYFNKYLIQENINCKHHTFVIILFSVDVVIYAGVKICVFWSVGINYVNALFTTHKF